ncbi:hypothetical protein AVMA1855_23820 [Acidovorax sp. SUPP1855]|uniref:hypothetical protein n=1 Tax=Acidovorax sp. SUPP1855 TaxID=431774 RepID=UPI0023DE1AF5|nr:hypothetical protein [Acidovorax sp. SUPP1855]GKS87238.1 hypothetical protein AVMA1855_23820 [Acidovorax sp. SUPP1855]
MNTSLKTLSLLSTLLAAAALLSACGGGSDSLDERAASLTVTNASVSGLDGSYGNGNINASEVTKIAAAGTAPELCSFTFDGADRVGGDGTASGTVRYANNADSLYRLVLNVRGREFATASGDGDDTDVHHSRDYLEIVNKRLTATDGTGDTLRVTGLLTLRGNRPAGC